MTIPAQVSRVQYTAQQDETVFVYPFKIFAENNLDVYLTPNGETPDPGNDLLVLDEDYTVQDVGNETGGTITLVEAADEGDLLVINRDIPAERETDYETGGDFTAKSFNTQLDKLTALIQQNETLITERGVLYEVNQELDEGNTVLPKLDAGEMWKANGDGNLVAVTFDENEDWSTLRSELASQSSTAPGTDLIGSYDAQNSTPSTLTERLDNIQADLKSETEAAPGAALVGFYNELAETGATLQYQLNHNLKILRYYFHGFYTTWEDNTKITIGAGECGAQTAGSGLILLENSLTKLITATWALGDDVGGMASGVTLTAETWYHVFAMGNPEGTKADVGYDSSISATNLQSDASVQAEGFTLFRYIYSVYVNNSSHILRYAQEGNSTVWHTPALQIDEQITDENEHLYEILCPPVEGAIANINVYAEQTTALSSDFIEVYVSSPLTTDLAADTAGLATFQFSDDWSTDNDLFPKRQVLRILTSDSTVRVRCSTTTTLAVDIEIATLGWEYSRGP